uniref:NADH-ubiquinone oxidoreductase chain 4 n=1 Tax=Homoeoxipha nigripes TaxID=2697520 RepID=A0A6B9VYL2_9ORTH|nr:NADH dehydrogenase subunit 4 [Homoeoxipha nigripes]QHQ73129.1 NADH dehydrogenase subunit 4 [Homoeoxipha nigripes]
MLKIIFMTLFLIPCCFLKKNYWFVVQGNLMLIIFLMMMNLVMGNKSELLSLIFGCDMLSFGLNLLSLWICMLMVLASINILNLNNHGNIFLFLILILLVFLICTFSSLSIISFYIFFEASLIPTLLLILGWGYQPERIQAGLYLLFYTLFASLPLLIGLMWIGQELMIVNFCLSKDIKNMSFLFYFVMIFAFLVKMPMYLVHLWLPKAHVEAPISGSMILAGVLLKLGGYGLIRMLKMMIYMSIKFSFLWISISMVGGIMVSLLCLRQVDIKSLIAYSSVAHMSLVLGGIFTLNYWGLWMGFLMMISHGLCSSGLFCLSNIMYERIGSRSMIISKGMMNLMPSMTLWWFLLISSNMSAPPSLNLLSEIGLINSIMSWSQNSMFLLMLISFFSAMYSIYLYSYTQHGKFYSGIYMVVSGNHREYLLLFLHWIPLNLLILKSEYFLLCV